MPDTYNISAFLRQQAAERPDQVALRFMVPHAGPGRPVGTELSFAELDSLSDRYARGFERIGLKRGMRTLVLARPELDFFAFMFGLFKMGAIPVLLDPGMGMKRLLACIETNAPEAMVALPLVHLVRLFVRRPFATVKTLVTVGKRWLWGGSTLEDVLEAGSQESGPYELQDFSADDEAAIIFTSGSTGPPKGGSFRHGAFHQVVGNVQQMFDFQPGEAHLEAFASFAFWDVCAGMTVVIPKGNLTKMATVDPADVVAAIQGSACSCALASPIVWANVLRWCQDNQVKLDTLTRAITMGAPIQADMHRRFQEVAGVELHTPYGATESLTVSTISTSAILGETLALTARGQGTCIGHPVPGTEVFIIGITEAPIETWSDELCLPAREIGEITVGGLVVSPEYKDLPEANASSKIADGRRVLHRMGDLGYLDEDGRLWFCGRKTHRLQTVDGMVPAVPVEGVVNEHDAVFRSALVGVGASGAQVPVLLVELEAGEAWRPELEAELLAMFEGTRWEGVVAKVTPYEGFPVDPRHNSKIRRGHLKAWADTRFAELTSALETT